MSEYTNHGSDSAEHETKVNDFIFECYKSMGYAAGCMYLEPSITYDSVECKKNIRDCS